MKTKNIILQFLILAFLVAALGFFTANITYNNTNSLFVRHEDSLDVNNIRSYIWNTGVFNQSLRITNYPGFEWPKGTGKTAIYSSGLTLGAYVNNKIRLAAASFKGEYSPGYCVNGIFQTNSNFRFYSIKRGDNPSSPDWANWGLMVPFGAPYIDVNHNGTYEAAIDTPGVRSAAKTIFICLTDADPASHTVSEGFSGGTEPLGAEMHLIAWCYDNPGYQDMQFIRWAVINKNNTAWDSLYSTVYSNPGIGFGIDDYIGCDTTRDLAYCYNSDNKDKYYGVNPPAVGMMFLNCSGTSLHATSVNFNYCYGCPEAASCEYTPVEVMQAYWFMKGYKRDGTPYVIPNTTPPLTTKFTYSGDPETGTGWTEYNGKVNNCRGSLTGPLLTPVPPWERRIMMSNGPRIRMNPGDTQVVQICQLITRGAYNLNAVTRLKQLSDSARHLCETGFVIGIAPIVSEVPQYFNLHQNYPNPFNPTTKIKFDIPKSNFTLSEAKGLLVSLKIFDALGREVATLVNEQLKPGTYETEWDGTNYPSGIYFYRLEAGDYTQTRKLVLLK